MARIAGVDIPREKRVEVALTYIYGIGRTRSSDICEALNICRATRVRDLTDEEVVKVRNFIDENYQLKETSKRRSPRHQTQNRNWLLQGIRHRRGLPVWATHPYQRSYTQRSTKDCGGQKESP